MLPSNARHSNQGFTLIETLIILIIIGVLAAIAAPSFLGMLNRNKVNNALNQVRGALQEAQREAIRKSKPCTVTVNTTTKKVTGTCLVTGERTLPDGVEIATTTNINNNPIEFSYKGTITLIDAGTVVLFNSNIQQKRCLVISKPLAIIRVGNYSGSTSAGSTISHSSCNKT